MGTTLKRPKALLFKVAMLLGLAGLLLTMLVGAIVSAAPGDPDGVSFTLEGCRNDGTITLPNGAGKFICPDSAYTTGNLGKGWNELDLVPFRLTAGAGNSAPTNQTYTIAVVVDNFDAGHPGYDVLAVPVLNTVLSTSTCQSPSVGAATILSPGLGGISKSLYRLVTITQPRNSTCVYDYYARLALGSHLFPGSSLHANLANQNLGTGGIGSKEVSIPVKEILPQELNKDMTATQGTDHIWSITKEPMPATVSFGNTCDTSTTLHQPVAITVSWVKLPATPGGPITVLTHVYAKNPASRVVTVDVTDNIRSGTTVLDTASVTGVDVPANTTQLVLTHQTTVPDGTTNLNDVATATYTDKVTGEPVPGTTQATASASVQFTGPELNKSATINDVESITGANLSYSVDSFTGATGAFDGGYLAGTQTTGSVSWTSTSQSDSGSVTFNKTVYVEKGFATTGSLDDTATLTGSDGFTTSAVATIDISSNPKVSLTINKSLTSPLASGTQTFTFHVKDSNNVEVATPTITFAAGDSNKSVTVDNLAPGTYTVSEDQVTGWITDKDQSVEITLPSCGGSVSFSNTQLGSLKVTKTVDWKGVTPNPGQTFQICISGPSYPGGDCKTIGYMGGDLTWTDLKPGDYIVTETDPGTQWTVTVPAAPVTVPEGGQGTATVTNTHKLGSLEVTKTVNWNGVSEDPTQTFQICITGPSYPGGDCKTFGSNGGIQTWTDLIPGDYIVTENDPGTQWTVTVPGSAVTVPLDGGKATASVTNTRKLGSLKVSKVVNWNGVTPDPGQTFDICITGPSYPGGNCQTINYQGGELTWNNLIPGSYTISENNAGTQWTVTVSDSPAIVPADGGQATASVTNTRKLGSLKVTKTVNWNGVTPDTTQTFQICIIGPSFPTGDCKTIGYQGGDLLWENLIPGSYTVNETNPGTQWTMNITGSPANVPTDGGRATAGVTNTRKLGSLEVTKTVDWNGMTPDQSQTFQICITGPSYSTPNCKSVGYNGGTVTWTGLIPGDYTVTETNPGSQWIVTITGSPATVPADGGKATAGVNNKYNPGYAKVVKTVSGAAPSGTQAFTFQLRQGAVPQYPNGDGTIIETQVANAANGGVINFTTKLVPGATYQMCEVIMPGWTTSLTGGFVPNSVGNPIVDNSPICVNFTVNAGETKTISVDNAPPPGGRALTIGFWKNWASCAGSNGKQKPVLDQTLAQFPIASGQTTHGFYAGKVYVDTCDEAVSLLNKSDINTGKKMSSDPLYNLAAQYVAAKLNLQAGAYTTPAVTAAVDNAQALMAKYNFTGTGSYKLSAADATLANNLAKTLDDYNNDRLGP